MATLAIYANFHNDNDLDSHKRALIEAVETAAEKIDASDVLPYEIGVEWDVED